MASSNQFQIEVENLQNNICNWIWCTHLGSELWITKLCSDNYSWPCDLKHEIIWLLYQYNNTFTYFVYKLCQVVHRVVNNYPAGMRFTVLWHFLSTKQSLGDCLHVAISDSVTIPSFFFTKYKDVFPFILTCQ